MLNYHSVTNSELQVRSKPALRFVNPKSGFQKRLSTLLEPTPLPFPTFQLVKEASKQSLSQHAYHAWVRPAHLRTQWIVLADDMPLLLVDSKNSSKLCSLRIPFNKQRVQQIGPIILEGSWDHQDHILWIWDVVVWEKQLVWASMNYSRRWDLVKQTVSELLDCGHPMSDAEVRLPVWETISELSKRTEIESGWSVEFQPEKAGMRRQLLVLKSEDVAFIPKNHYERKQLAEEALVKPNLLVTKEALVKPNLLVTKEALVKPNHSLTKEVLVIENDLVEKVVNKTVAIPTNKLSERPTIARLAKDPHLKLPDTYRLSSVTEPLTDLGLSAIRSMDISKAIRLRLAKESSILVNIQWYEPFQKYDVKKICT